MDVLGACGSVSVVVLVCLVTCNEGLSQTSPRPSLELVSPNGSEVWAAESKHYIAWKASQVPAGDPVTIQYTIDGGKTWQKIGTAPCSEGKFLWLVPNTPSERCRVRVTDRALGVAGAGGSDVSIVPSQRVRDYRWENVTRTAAFAPRDGAGALIFEGQMWLLGGWNPRDKVNSPSTCNNEVWRSTDGAVWHLVKPNTFGKPGFDPNRDWEGRHTAGYVVYRNKMWIVGGDANQEHYHFDVWNSTNGKIWTHVNKDRPVPWGPRVLHYTLVFEDKIWVMGGQTLPQFAPAKLQFYSDTWNTSDGVTWTEITPKGPRWPNRGMIGGSVVFNNRMWILGGGTYDTPTVPKRKFYNDVWSSPDGMHWEQHVEHAPWTPRQYHDVAAFDGRMWVMEGWNHGNRNDVWYSADGVNWYELPNTPWNPRHAASVFVYDGALWMVAGNNMERDAWRLRRTPRARQ